MSAQSAAHKLYSEAPTRSSEHLGTVIGDRKLVFASDWHFKEDGVTLVRQLMERILVEPHVPFVLAWRGDISAFVVSCLPGETDAVSAAFHHTHQVFIDKECRVASENSEDSNADSDDGVADSDSDDGWGEPRPINSKMILSLSEWEQIKHLVVPETTQPQIAPNSNPAEQTRPLPRASHIFLCEGTADVQVVLRNILDVRKKYFETTLLDNIAITRYEFNYNNLPSAIVTRCTVLDQKKNIYVPSKEWKYKAVTLPEETQLAYRDWADFNYREHGSANPMLPLEKKLPKSVTAKVPTLPVLDQVQPPPIKAKAEIYQWRGDVPVKTASSNPGPSIRLTEKKPDWDTYNPYDENVKTDIVKVESKPLLSRRLVPTPSNIQQPPQLAHTQTPLHLSPTPTAAAYLPPVSMVTTYAPQPQDLLDDDAATPLDYPSLLDTSVCVLTPDNSDDLISLSDEPTPMQQASSDLGGELLDFRSESQQQVSEASTRQFHTTMDQTAPKPSRGRRQENNEKPGPQFANRLPIPSPPRPKPAKSPNNDFAEDLSQVGPELYDMLDASKGYRGEVRVQADFGRILLKGVPNNLITKKESSKSHTRDRLSDLLSKNPANSTFTKVISTIPQDLHYLVDLKDEAGAGMWEPKPSNWHVFYEFRYQVKASGLRVIIEMDAENTNYTIHTHENLGRIYLHGIKRHWDLRMTVNGCTNAMDEHSELGNAIKGTLFIPPKLELPSLSYEVTSVLAETYQLEAIRVHRTTKYRNTQFNSVLNVCEIQDLDVKAVSSPNPNAQVVVFQAFRNTMPRDPSLKLVVWYEASISCPGIDELLKQNLSLQIGEVAKWSTNDMQKLHGSVQILQPACRMIQQMDGVGFYNLNGVEVRSQDDVPPPPPEPEQFW